MRIRAVFIAVLTLALLSSLLPAAHADTDGEFRPVEQPSPEMVEAILQEAQGQTSADVFDGAFVARGAHPYVGLVLLLDPRTGEVFGSCSGSLIRPRYVLTAGHCTKGVRGALFIPKVIDLADVKPKDIFTASAIATAPRYSPRTLRHDAGLLRLSRAVDVEPVAVAGSADDERYLGGTEARVVGWGAIDSELTFPNRLRRDQIQLLSIDGCYAAWGAAFKHASMICGGSKVTDTCIGDSGGPLLVRDKNKQWLLHGVTSFGKALCAPRPDSGYTRVSSVRTWIERVTGLAPRRTSPTFRDVNPRQRHFDSILTIVDEDIAAGLPDGTYRPDRAVSRGQMASFLARALDLDASEPPPFDDVDPEYVHAEAIAAIAEAGITNGSHDGAFDAAGLVTRAQMASFLARALDLPAAGEPPFSDVREDSVHAPAIAAVAKAKISTGYADGTFRPNERVTRAQMAGFLARALDLQVLRPSI